MSIENITRTIFFCAVCVISTPAIAVLGTSFGRNVHELNNKDAALLESSIHEVLDARIPGMAVVWQDDETRQSGRSLLLRVYERRGMSCAEVEHVFTSGLSNPYMLPFC